MMNKLPIVRIENVVLHGCRSVTKEGWKVITRARRSTRFVGLRLRVLSQGSRPRKVVGASVCRGVSAGTGARGHRAPLPTYLQHPGHSHAGTTWGTGGGALREGASERDAGLGEGVEGVQHGSSAP